MLTNISTSKQCFPNSKTGPQMLVNSYNQDLVYFQTSLPYTEATTTLFNPPNSCSDVSITKHALEAMMLGFVQVTQKQLSDFLPGGEFPT